jgi:hypothetical protein
MGSGFLVKPARARIKRIGPTSGIAYRASERRRIRRDIICAGSHQAKSQNSSKENVETFIRKETTKTFLSPTIMC